MRSQFLCQVRTDDQHMAEAAISGMRASLANRRHFRVSKRQIHDDLMTTEPIKLEASKDGLAAHCTQVPLSKTPRSVACRVSSKRSAQGGPVNGDNNHD